LVCSKSGLADRNSDNFIPTKKLLLFGLQQSVITKVVKFSLPKRLKMSKLDLNGFFIISVEKRFGGLMSDQIRSN
jgi:hypothetical protein